MLKKLKIKKGSSVFVTTGDDKGKTGSVLEVDPFAMKVKVQGVRIQTKRDKKENTLYKEEGYIDYSNLKLVDGSAPKKKKAKKKAAKKQAAKKVAKKPTAEKPKAEAPPA